MRQHVPPTKSTLLNLRRQLDFAQEGFDLLEQKREILISELMKHMERVQELEDSLARAFAEAHQSLREASLRNGSHVLDGLAVGILTTEQRVVVRHENLMGLKIPELEVHLQPLKADFGVTASSIEVDFAVQHFVNILPLVAQFAELENTILKVSKELRKTQRRCNALSKLVIPSLKQTIGYIGSLLEERERESFTKLKFIRNRLLASRGRAP